MLKEICPFNVRPRQFQNCWLFDHVSRKCKFEMRCSTCFGGHFELTSSSEINVCGNGKGFHEATNSSCSCSQHEMNKLKFKFDQHIPVMGACHQFRSTDTFEPDTSIFATAVKTSETAFNFVSSPVIAALDFNALLTNFLEKPKMTLCKFSKIHYDKFFKDLADSFTAHFSR